MNTKKCLVAAMVLNTVLLAFAVSLRHHPAYETQRGASNAALTPVHHSPRRLLVLGNNRPDTYVFRTAEGTLGMLRIVGLDQHRRGVTICYKLVNPAKSIVATRLSGSQPAVVSR